MDLGQRSATESQSTGCGSTDKRRPLPALFALAEAAFAEEFDSRLRDSEFEGLSLAHSRNVLQYLGHGPLRASAIVDQCNLTKQAVSQQIAYLERHHYVRVEPDPTDQRARLVSLTQRGTQAQAHVRGLFEQIEQAWAAEVGSDDLATVRATLTSLLRARHRNC